MANYGAYAGDVISRFAGSVRAPVGTVAPPPVPPPPPPSPPYSGPTLTFGASSDPLGAGLIRPFARTEHQDFATSSGVPLVLSCIEQVLGTALGSLPWEPGFGSLLYRLRHRSQDPTFLDLAKIYSADAIKRWEPRAEVIDLVRDQAYGSGDPSAVGLIVKVKIGSKVYAANASI